MPKYTVTLRDRVYMEMEIKVDASSRKAAISMANEMQHTGEYEWATTKIRCARPLVEKEQM